MINLSKYFFRFRYLFPLPVYLICLLDANYSKTNFYSGLALLLSGMVLRFYSVGYIGIRSRSLTKPIADKLILSGPFQLVRNPIYEGNVLIYLGFTVLSNVFFPYLVLAVWVYFWLIYEIIIQAEEYYLLSAFGDSYKNYCKIVKRWIPRFNPSKQHMGEKGESFDISGAVRSERSTWLTLLAALTVMICRMLI